MNLNIVLSPEIIEGIKVLGIMLALFHLLWAALLFRQLISMLNTVTTLIGKTIIALSTLHVLALIGILLLIIFA